MPAAAISSSSCGPAPCTTIGVRPTCCRKASEDTSASSSSRRIAPPTLTTANLAASSCEKRLRYCWISLALAMLESKRTMVVRVSFMTSAEDALIGVCNGRELIECDPFVSGMRLRDVAGAVDERGQAGRGKQRGLGPEIDGVADRHGERISEIACFEAAVLRIGDVARWQRWAAEGFLVLRKCTAVGEAAEIRMQRIEILRWQWPEAETHLRRWRDHIRLDAAFDAADIETQPGHSTEAKMRQRADMIERLAAPAHRLVQCTEFHRVCVRCVPRLPLEQHANGNDAAMREHRFGQRRFGDDHFAETMIGLEKGVYAARVVGLLVGTEQESGRTTAAFRSCQQTRRGTFDIAGAQADRAITRHAQFERIGRPCRRARHGVEMHVEQPRCLPAHGEQRHRAGTMVDDIDAEARQVRAQIVEDAAGADRPRRIARI